MDPNNFNRWFRDWCCEHGFGERIEEEEPYVDSQGRKRTHKYGYRGLTPHMLRHTQATLLIGANADTKTVQARLGHSSVNLTLNKWPFTRRNPSSLEPDVPFPPLPTV